MIPGTFVPGSQVRDVYNTFTAAPGMQMPGAAVKVK